MNHLLTWLATAVLLVAAGFVSAIAPAEDVEVAPFVATGEIGDQVAGRDIVATVTDARTSTAVHGQKAPSVEGHPWTSDGNWLVVDVDLASITGPNFVQLIGAVSLSGAVFVQGGIEYRATERATSMLNQRLQPEIPRHGSLAFELAELTGSGVLRLSLDSDVRMDSVLEIPIDLDALTPLADTEIVIPEWNK